MAPVELARRSHELSEGPRAGAGGERSTGRPARQDDREHEHRERSGRPGSGRRGGVLASRLIELDTVATAPQKTCVSGRARGRARPAASGSSERMPSIQVNGSRHWLLVVGPGRPVVVALLLLAPVAVDRSATGSGCRAAGGSGIRTGLGDDAAAAARWCCRSRGPSRPGRSRRRRRSRRRWRASRPAG